MELWKDKKIKIKKFTRLLLRRTGYSSRPPRQPCHGVAQPQRPSKPGAVRRPGPTLPRDQQGQAGNLDQKIFFSVGTLHRHL